jgi:hypothetical protein
VPTLTAFFGWFAFGWVTVGLFSTFGFSLAGRQLVAYMLGLGLLAIALECVWRRPVAQDQGSEVPSPETHRLGRGARNALLSVGIALLWGLWVASAMPSFWLVLVIIALPLANRITQRTIEHLLQPPGAPQAGDGPPSVIAVSLERGMRALLITGAEAVLAWGWGSSVRTRARRRARRCLAERGPRSRRACDNSRKRATFGRHVESHWSG